MQYYSEMKRGREHFSFGRLQISPRFETEFLQNKNLQKLILVYNRLIKMGKQKYKTRYVEFFLSQIR